MHPLHNTHGFPDAHHVTLQFIGHNCIRAHLSCGFARKSKGQPDKDNRENKKETIRKAIHWVNWGEGPPLKFLEHPYAN